MDVSLVTQLLGRAAQGEHEAQQVLMPLLYGQLHAIAKRLRQGERHAHSLNTTALVHELYLGLFARALPTFADRQHFYRYAAQAMRHLLVDHARAALAQKRGERAELLALTGLQLRDGDSVLHVLALEQALASIVQLDARMAQVLELRFFAGLSESEVAQLLNIDVRTVRRDWQKARAHVLAQVQGLDRDEQS
jgi:RNA polymerase sigma factor (TIGR02999 family)